jgi:hypothetical protein
MAELWAAAGTPAAPPPVKNTDAPENMALAAPAAAGEAAAGSRAAWAGPAAAGAAALALEGSISGRAGPPSPFK